MSFFYRWVLNYLHLPGLALVAMGTVMGLFSERWWPWPGVLLAIGLGCLTIRLGLVLYRSGWLTAANRRLLAPPAGAIMVALALNAVIASYGWRFDLTENQLYTLSGQTKQVLQSLPQPVKVWVFTAQRGAGNDELLATYRQQNPLFSYEFADPQSTIAQKFQVQTAGEVHLEKGGEKRRIQSLYPGQALTEVQLTAALETGLRPPLGVVWLQGHGEPAPEQWRSAQQSLRTANYRLQPLVLAQSALPQNTALVAWVGAKQPLLLPEAQALSAYLQGGGRLLVLADPGANLGAESLLEAWGLQLTPRLVHTAVQNRVETGAIVTTYGDHPITRHLGENISFYPAARPITWKQQANQETVPLLTTSDRSWSSPLGSTPGAFQAGRDQRGPLVLGVAATRGKARLVAIGSAQFIQEGTFDRYVNSDILLNALGWLSDREALAIRPKEITNRRIELSWGQTQLLFWLPIVLLPGASFALGGWFWWQRR